MFYALAFTLAMASGAVAGLSNLFLIVAVAYGAHLARQVRDVRGDDPKGALRLFRSNRDAGLILFAAIALGAWNG